MKEDFTFNEPVHIQLKEKVKYKSVSVEEDSQPERSIKKLKYMVVFKMAATKHYSLEVETPDHLWSW